MYATLRHAAGGVLGLAEGALFAACGAAEQIFVDVTAYVTAAADHVRYRLAEDRAAHALSQIKPAVERHEVPAQAAWMRRWATSQRELAELQEASGSERRGPGGDGLATPRERRHAADLADALANADEAAYRRDMHLDNDVRMPAPHEIELIAGDRLDHPERIHHGTSGELEGLIADLRPVCGEGVHALALLRGHPVAA